MDNRVEMHIRHDDFSESVGVYIIRKQDGKRYVATSLTWEEVGDGMMFDASLRVAKTALESLPNELDTMGLRPTSQNAQRGELAATKYHLEDMRKLAKVAK